MIFDKKNRQPAEIHCNEGLPGGEVKTINNFPELYLFFLFFNSG